MVFWLYRFPTYDFSIRGILMWVEWLLVSYYFCTINSDSQFSHILFGLVSILFLNRWLITKQNTLMAKQGHKRNLTNAVSLAKALGLQNLSTKTRLDKRKQHPTTIQNLQRHKFPFSGSNKPSRAFQESQSPQWWHQPTRAQS
jgi:hypothetical protein